MVFLAHFRAGNTVRMVRDMRRDTRETESPATVILLTVWWKLMLTGSKQVV